MRLVQLRANLVTERGGESTATETLHMEGSQAGGVGSRIARIAKQETDNGSGGVRTRINRNPTLSDLKRILAKHGKYRGILGLLGRD